VAWERALWHANEFIRRAARGCQLMSALYHEFSALPGCQPQRAQAVSCHTLAQNRKVLILKEI